MDMVRDQQERLHHKLGKVDMLTELAKEELESNNVVRAETLLLRAAQMMTEIKRERSCTRN